MVKRKKIGILFPYDESWTGGIYYLFNIINALKTLPDNEKPYLIFFYRFKEIINKIVDLQYPYYESLPIDKPLSVIERKFQKLLRVIGFKHYVCSSLYTPSIVDFIFPCDSAVYSKKGSLKNLNKVFWIPDFQHKHLPHLFSREQLAIRDEIYSGIAEQDSKLVLSSIDAKKDFERYYPNHRVQIKVVPFASVLPDFSILSMESLASKYSIAHRYFIAPNQFWVHKNQAIILKAAIQLNRKHSGYHILFTGKEYDFRSPEYADSLKTFVKEHNLESTVKFLGFIDRREQLKLMSASLAVIQPSFFEGWSTVVEDAKAMNQNLIVSDLRVHREQCGTRAVYFDPHNENELSQKLEMFLNGDVHFEQTDYQNSIMTFAKAVSKLNC